MECLWNVVWLIGKTGRSLISLNISWAVIAASRGCEKMQYWFGSYMSASSWYLPEDASLWTVRLAAEFYDPLVCVHCELSCIENIVICLLFTLALTVCIKATTSRYSKCCGSLPQAWQPDLLSLVKLIWPDFLVIAFFCYHLISSICGISKTLLLKWDMRWWGNPEKNWLFFWNWDFYYYYFLVLFPLSRLFLLLHLNQRYSTFEKNWTKRAFQWKQKHDWVNQSQILPGDKCANRFV